MGKKTNKLTKWVKDLIFKLDELFAKWFEAELEPKLYSVIGFSLIASVALVVVAIICQACGVNENAITAIFIIGTISIFGYIVKMLLPNINLIESILMKILYVALNFIAVFIAGTLAGYALSLVIMLICVYFGLMLFFGILGSDSSSSSSSESSSEERMCQHYDRGVCRHSDSGGETCPCGGDYLFYTCRFRN